MFEYDCIKGDCEGTCTGSFGDNVVCPICSTEYETDWDYTNTNEGNMAAWLTTRIAQTLKSEKKQKRE